jgi:hypothetical protein
LLIVGLLLSLSPAHIVGRSGLSCRPASSEKIYLTAFLAITQRSAAEFGVAVSGYSGEISDDPHHSALSFDINVSNALREMSKHRQES